MTVYSNLDIISYNTADSDTHVSHSLDESNIAWSSDSSKFIQPSGFRYVLVTNVSVSCSDVGLASGCKTYCDSSSNCYKFYYPNDDTIQYLYESYPDQISPIVGVTDQHFKVRFLQGFL